MKRVVWKNKSNGQLCVTIPKGSEVKEGDLVEVKKKSIKRIAYCGVVADFFHYGHLQAIQFAKSISDYNICGLLTDEAVEAYRVRPLADFQERKAVLTSLNCVDRVMVQNSRDPTENLEKIHEEFPEAELILCCGSNLKDVPGLEYIQKINGQLRQHPYYSRLSTFKVITYILENKDKFKDLVNFTSYIQKGEKFASEPQKSPKMIISSKADTLKALQPLLTKSKIELMVVFTISDWKNKKVSLIEEIQKELGPGKIVVRSSAVNEDTLDQSMAGCFESVLNVDSNKEEEIEKAVEKVLHSYKKKNAESSFNQILVQKQTPEIIMSGVVFTRTLEKNAPYYVINYDNQTGGTDSVTSGRENQTITFSRFAPEFPQTFTEVMEAVQEIEQKIIELPLDIEFALTSGKDAAKEVVIFQVRPLAVNVHKEKEDWEVSARINSLKKKFQALSPPPPHLVGEKTFFADMPDWNPAEIIGDNPHLLDYSLYDYIITNKAWHEARTSQGYYNVNPAKLIELFGNKPYVNVRNSFNSFTPASISHHLRQKLVSFYLQKLKGNPPFQDKVEFEVLYTCYDLDFPHRSQELLSEGFSLQEVEELRQALLQLTNNLIVNYCRDVDLDLQAVFTLEKLREKIRESSKGNITPSERINLAQELLDDCRKLGTVQFSRLARLAFIGKIFLRSLVRSGIIGQKWSDLRLNSIRTVATKINEDFKKLSSGEITKEKFLKEYYHLRPGTYDITSPRYETNPDLLKEVNLELTEEEKPLFELEPALAEKITAALKLNGLNFDAYLLMDFIQVALEARELSKFEFTKNLSDALELLAQAGEEMGFTRQEISHLDINEIFKINSRADVQEISRLWKEIIKVREKERTINNKLVLPEMIFSKKNFDLIQYYQAKPNFITRKKVQGKVVYLQNFSQSIPELENSIVILENGDPGYDWIFTRKIAGLITKYGGVASHMSIRCAEFRLPAAIGCGELLFNKVKKAQEVILDCQFKKIIPLH